jgi:hypothetical protein
MRVGCSVGSSDVSFVRHFTCEKARNKFSSHCCFRSYLELHVADLGSAEHLSANALRNFAAQRLPPQRSINSTTFKHLTKSRNDL